MTCSFESRDKLAVAFQLSHLAREKSHSSCFCSFPLVGSVVDAAPTTDVAAVGAGLAVVFELCLNFALESGSTGIVGVVLAAAVEWFDSRERADSFDCNLGRAGFGLFAVEFE